MKSELRLDIRDRALKGGESGKPAIVPGKPGESMVVKHITSTDPEEVMPPPKAHMKFTAEDAAKLTRWIKEGIDHQRLTYPYRGLDQKLTGVEAAKIIAKALA